VKISSIGRIIKHDDDDDDDDDDDNQNTTSLYIGHRCGRVAFSAYAILVKYGIIFW
jgi:hypothetical protein